MLIIFPSKGDLTDSYYKVKEWMNKRGSQSVFNLSAWRMAERGVTSKFSCHSFAASILGHVQIAVGGSIEMERSPENHGQPEGLGYFDHNQRNFTDIHA